MSMSKTLVAAGFVLAFAAGFALHGIVGPAPTVQEMRTYVASAGRFEALKARFRDHTIAAFNRHGMTSIGYWQPAMGAPGAGNTLTYILAYPSREARDKELGRLQRRS
jgi:hypothetical protein